MLFSLGAINLMARSDLINRVTTIYNKGAAGYKINLIGQ